jgi:hypothetical protein
MSSPQAWRHCDIAIARGIDDEHVGAAHLRALTNTHPSCAGRSSELEVDLLTTSLGCAGGHIKRYGSSISVVYGELAMNLSCCCCSMG